MGCILTGEYVTESRADGGVADMQKAPEPQWFRGFQRPEPVVREGGLEPPRPI